MKRLIALTAFLVPFAMSAAASAAEPTPPASNAADADKTPLPEHAPEFKHVSITANPLSVAIGRYSVNAEYLPVPHHAIVLNPNLWTFSVDVSGANGSTASSRYTNIGAELGYHFYTGDKGANGFYVGPSLIVMNANLSASASNGGSSSSGSTNMFFYGGALDIGGQAVLDGGFTIGGGAGVMYLKSGESNAPTASFFKNGAVLPRILFTIGYSF